ncbi:hypothetical protein, partial [Gemmiger sp.]|uniref:hypothetical protein n=1 Tax=Gemmiger sp. TaxID=2049027 RepID=UPI0039C5C9F3
ISLWPFSALLTVATDTPHSAAMTLMETIAAHLTFLLIVFASLIYNTLPRNARHFLKKSVGNDRFGGVHSLSHENLYENHEEFASKFENDFHPNSRRGPQEKRGCPAPKKAGKNCKKR